MKAWCRENNKENSKEGKVEKTVEDTKNNSFWQAFLEDADILLVALKVFLSWR